MFGCSKELSHRDSSFEYPQHNFWLRNKKNNFQLRTLFWGPAGDLIFGLSLTICMREVPTHLVLAHTWYENLFDISIFNHIALRTAKTLEFRPF